MATKQSKATRTSQPSLGAHYRGIRKVKLLQLEVIAGSGALQRVPSAQGDPGTTVTGGSSSRTCESREPLALAAAARGKSIRFQHAWLRLTRGCALPPVPTDMELIQENRRTVIFSEAGRGRDRGQDVGISIFPLEYSTAESAV